MSQSPASDPDPDPDAAAAAAAAAAVAVVSPRSSASRRQPSSEAAAAAAEEELQQQQGDPAARHKKRGSDDVKKEGDDEDGQVMEVGRAKDKDNDDDGWQPVWEESAQAFYFYNQFSGQTTWINPRVPVPEEPSSAAPTGTGGIGNHDRLTGDEDEDEPGPGPAPPPLPSSLPSAPAAARARARARARPYGGYDPSVHGDYDATAPYALAAAAEETEPPPPPPHPHPHLHHLDPAAALGAIAGAPAGAAGAAAYEASGAFNRFSGVWQAGHVRPENHNDENKSRRQLNAFFDVDAAANSHDGKSLKAERAGKKLSKQEVKAFKEKRREKKEEKRRAWLRD